MGKPKTTGPGKTCAAIKDEELIQKPEPTPDCMQDEPRPQQEPLEEINLNNGAGPRKPVFISKALEGKFREKLITLLCDNSDVFMWHYEEMPGLDPTLVAHHQDVFPNSKPTKQSQRKIPPQLRGTNQGQGGKVEKSGLHLTNTVPQMAREHHSGEEKERSDPNLCRFPRS